jgi:hypothetical protein
MSCFRALGRKWSLVIVLLFGYVNFLPVAFWQPVGPLNGLFTVTVSCHTSIRANGLYHDYKTHRWVSGSPV